MQYFKLLGTSNLRFKQSRMLALCAVLHLSLLGIVAKTTHITPNTTRVLRNPLNGWVMYMGRTWDENFWTERGYDNISVGGDSTVRVSDYANTCYVRTSWSSLEPREGEYAWNDPQSRISKLFQSVLDRRMKLAFRIVVDSRDQGQNTPIYVKEAGAKGFQDPGNPRNWSPYPDDPVFQEKYTRFIEALAKQFNDPDKVDFIDAYGLGKWGEAHGVKYGDYSHKEEVFQWITNVYTRTFTRIPLVINYHRLVGDTVSWSGPHDRSKALLEDAIRKGYSLRHDAFGMTGYYQQWERDFAAQWNYRRPIVMEGGWITGAHHRYWIDPSNRYREGHAEDVRKGEYQDAEEGHVNMMDLRVGDETKSWFGTSFDLVKRFVAEGGYRLYPSQVTAPDRVQMKQGSVQLESVWNNLGWGYCPTNIPQWNQKYKVAYALMQGDTAVRIYVDERSDLSTWLRGNPTASRLTVDVQGIRAGRYHWAVALVDTTRNNSPALEMAVDTDNLSNGWLLLNEVKIK